MEDDLSQPLIRASVINDVTDYPHNDVELQPIFSSERLKQATEEKERGDVILLDLIALVTMTSFALEGYVNALAPAHGAIRGKTADPPAITT